MPDGTASLEAALAIMSSAFGLDGLSRMRSVAQRAVDLEKGLDFYHRLVDALLGPASSPSPPCTTGTCPGPSRTATAAGSRSSRPGRSPTTPAMSPSSSATAEGVPVDGYFHWSAQDNLEWMDGFGNRFGLIYVDFDTQQRIPKLSAEWFRRAARQNAVV